MDQAESKLNLLIIITLLLSTASLFIFKINLSKDNLLILGNLLDIIILGFLFTEVIFGFRLAVYKATYIRKNIFSLLFVAIFISLFVYNKLILFTPLNLKVSIILIARNFFLLLKIASRSNRVRSIIANIHVHPAKSIFISFLLVIMVGTLLLMMPFTAVEGNGLPFLNALFTSTSAVCVTGLVVVDTATYFSIWGQIIILILIQIGGLGIMILSYFTVFILRRAMSVENKLLISYMLSDDDMNNISRTMKSIIGFTFLIESVGALFLFAGFLKNTSLEIDSLIFYSIFHSISAFCNAGFALFSDNLEGFNTSLLLSGGVAILIIAGGIGFSVIANLKSIIVTTIRRKLTGNNRHQSKLTLNTRVVLSLSTVFLISGTLLFYTLEHNSTLKTMDIGSQYLTAFFQSVTLRTAGFNTVSFESLAPSMLIVMILFMFIGAASGSTAGGIKLNTLAVLGSVVKSAWKNEKNVTLFKQAIHSEVVLKAFIILLFGVIAVTSGTFLLAITENAPLEDIMFEVVSAFGTVGLSTGVTSGLSSFGRIVIILLMFTGRIGSLTVLAVASTGSKKLNVTYPMADISIG